MAKVKSANISSSFYVNKPSFPELKYGLEITENCPSKYEFDISLLLSDNEAHLEKQYTDNDNWSGEKCENKEVKCPSKKAEAECPKLASFGTLVEKHLKNNKMLPELSFDGDFDLSDLLSNVDCPVANISKYNACENDNSFDLSFLIEDDNATVKKTSAVKNDISFDDLSDWMNSSVTHTADSLLLNHQLIDDTESNLETISSVSFKIKTQDIDADFQLSDCLISVQEKSEYTDNVSDIDLVNLLRKVSVNNSEATDSLNSSETTGSFDCSETNSESCESTREILDLDLPDIDLTNCIKKSKNTVLFCGSCPQSADSGFDESYFTSHKLSILPEKILFRNDLLEAQSGTCSRNITRENVKQSLFSIAISAKPKIDNSKKLKLKNVMTELLKGSMPLMQCNQQRSTQKKCKVIDHSNECIVVSNYSKIPNGT